MKMLQSKFNQNRNKNEEFDFFKGRGGRGGGKETGGRRGPSFSKL